MHGQGQPGRLNMVFEKHRKLLMATYDSLGKAIDRIGPGETRKITEAIQAELADRRDKSGREG